MAQTQNQKDLAHARTKTSFDVSNMTRYLYAGPENVEQRRYIIDLIAREPIFNKDDWYGCSNYLITSSVLKMCPCKPAKPTTFVGHG